MWSRKQPDIEAVTRAEAFIIALPAQAIGEVLSKLPLPRNAALIITAKGIERGSLRFMHEVVREAAPASEIYILSGPSFASDVARGQPTAVTLAASEATLATELAKALASRTFRPYQSSDVRGVEIGGAAKNVLAIAAGIVAGRGLGASASAALVTRGFTELVRFGKAFGAKSETLTGLSGLGDLTLTCGGPQSRNFSFGAALGKGEPPDKASHGKLAEGAFTAPVLLEMAREKNVEMPISSAVAAVIAGRLSVDQAIDSLLARPLREE